MKVFKLFTFLIVMLMLTSNVFSQGRPKANKDWDGTKPEALKGATSFVFIYAPFVSGSLGSAPAGSYSKFIDSTETQINNMAGFGFQYYISNKVSIVAGLRIGYNNSKNTDLTLNEITQSSAEWGFSGDLNYHLPSLYSVSPYVGVNGNVGLFSSSYESVSKISSAKKEEKWNGLVFSGGLNVGFDWYFTPGLSLGGKYTMRMSLISSPKREIITTSSSGTVSTSTQHGPSEFRWENNVTSIILNVHF